MWLMMAVLLLCEFGWTDSNAPSENQPVASSVDASFTNDLLTVGVEYFPLKINDHLDPTTSYSDSAFSRLWISATAPFHILEFGSNVAQEEEGRGNNNQDLSLVVTARGEANHFKSSPSATPLSPSSYYENSTHKDFRVIGYLDLSGPDGKSLPIVPVFQVGYLENEARLSNRFGSQLSRFRDSASEPFFEVGGHSQGQALFRALGISHSILLGGGVDHIIFPKSNNRITILELNGKYDIQSNEGDLFQNPSIELSGSYVNSSRVTAAMEKDGQLVGLSTYASAFVNIHVGTDVLEKKIENALTTEGK